MNIFTSNQCLILETLPNNFNSSSFNNINVFTTYVHGWLKVSCFQAYSFSCKIMVIVDNFLQEDCEQLYLFKYKSFKSE